MSVIGFRRRSGHLRFRATIFAFAQEGLEQAENGQGEHRRRYRAPPAHPEHCRCALERRGASTLTTELAALNEMHAMPRPSCGVARGIAGTGTADAGDDQSTLTRSIGPRRVSASFLYLSMSKGTIVG